ncbi:MAG: hypothetical protein ACK5XN_21665, partial [Bacteroidota bacterium]
LCIRIDNHDIRSFKINYSQSKQISDLISNSSIQKVSIENNDGNESIVFKVIKDEKKMIVTLPIKQSFNDSSILCDREGIRLFGNNTIKMYNSCPRFKKYLKISSGDYADFFFSIKEGFFSREKFFSIRLTKDTLVYKSDSGEFSFFNLYRKDIQILRNLFRQSANFKITFDTSNNTLNFFNSAEQTVLVLENKKYLNEEDLKNTTSLLNKKEAKSILSLEDHQTLRNPRNSLKLSLVQLSNLMRKKLKDSDPYSTKLNNFIFSKQVNYKELFDFLNLVILRFKSKSIFSCNKKILDTCALAKLKIKYIKTEKRKSFLNFLFLLFLTSLLLELATSDLKIDFNKLMKKKVVSDKSEV